MKIASSQWEVRLIEGSSYLESTVYNKNYDNKVSKQNKKKQRKKKEEEEEEEERKIKGNKQDSSSSPSPWRNLSLPLHY